MSTPRESMSAMRCSGVQPFLGFDRADPRFKVCQSSPDVVALMNDWGVEWACMSMVRTYISDLCKISSVRQ